MTGQDEQFNEGERSSGALKLPVHEAANRAVFAKRESNDDAKFAMRAITRRSSSGENFWRL